MKKTMCMLFGLMLLGVPCFGQSPTKTIKLVLDKTALEAAKTSKRAANVSSKQLKSQLKMSITSAQLAQSLHQQKVTAVMLEESLDYATKMAMLKQINAEDAKILKEWTETVTAERMRWAEALVRERNPKFLPPKDKEIPGLLTMAPEEGLPDLTPFYLREWARLIPVHQQTPEQYQGLILGLRQQLIRHDMRFRALEERMLKTAERFEQEGKQVPEVFYVSQVEKLSKESAQCVADLVSLLNLYPALYNESLKLLAAKLDVLGYTSPFIEYIRPQLPASGLEGGASIEDTPRKVVRGFAQYMDEKKGVSKAAAQAASPAEANKGRKVVKGFSKE